MARMLVGIKVLDLSSLLPGPFCTQLLCDLGAEVIKVERPGVGDLSRQAKTNFGGYGSTFIMINRNKKSITLNLKSKEGGQIFRRLAGSADVVIETFRPGVVDRLGISYQALRLDNRKLIYCSLTGWGQDGPYSHLPGHDVNYLSHAGLAGLTGKRGGAPTLMGLQFADVAGGSMMAAFAIMSALYHRNNTGRGQYIDVAMIDGSLSVAQTLYGEYLAGGEVPEPGSLRLSGGFPGYMIYQTKDNKSFAIGALEEKFFNAFCDKVGRDDIKDLYQSGWDDDRDKLEAKLVELFKSRTRDEWTELLFDADTCCTPVLDFGEAREDPQVKSRGVFVKGPHPEGGEVDQVSFPIKFSDVEPVPPGPAPRLGEHTGDILLSVGYSKKEIKEFKKNGIV